MGLFFCSLRSQQSFQLATLVKKKGLGCSARTGGRK